MFEFLNVLYRKNEDNKRGDNKSSNHHETIKHKLSSIRICMSTNLHYSKSGDKRIF